MCNCCPQGSRHHAMARFATCNVGRGATSKVSVIARLSMSLKNAFMALQEIDINQFSGPSWVSQWNAFGFQVCLGP